MPVMSLHAVTTGQVPSRSPSTLNTLPSEIRQQIVSHLTPDPTLLHPGCKTHLKNANLAHSCLREWVTEYLFRDMALIHVLPGMSSHLELFAVSRENKDLIKYVKHVVVQVPPAIRWEVGIDNPFALHLEEVTKQRLAQRFRVKNYRQMTDEQQQYCVDYHRAMVEPFTDNRRWHQLFRSANATWSHILRRFTHLEKISVGCCERIDQPRPTYTHTFLLQHGKLVEEDVHPNFIEDSSVNMAWASSVICRSAPPTVRSLQLSMSNMDNFNSVATVNRLLSLSYRQPDVSQSLFRIIRLELRICGVPGVHGERDWHGDTGSAGSVRFWKRTLNSLPALQHLSLCNTPKKDLMTRFTELENSDTKACILDWLLPGLAMSQLRTLRIHDFVLDIASIKTTLSSQWPRLQTLSFNDVKLMLRVDKGQAWSPESLRHIQGYSWLEVYQAILDKHPSVNVELIRPISNLNDWQDFRLDPKCAQDIRSMPCIVVNDNGPYRPLVSFPNEAQLRRQAPSMPRVPPEGIHVV